MIEPSGIRQLLSGQLFRNIGSGRTNDSDAIVSSLDVWRAFTESRATAEFGLKGGNSARMPEFHWLSEPFGMGSVRPRYRSEVMELYAVALRGLRTVPPSPWIQVGRTDYLETIKLMLRHAIRMALAEVSRPSSDLWESVLICYCDGRWPMGATEKGALVVL